jgi:hypothetical protein
MRGQPRPVNAVDLAVAEQLAVGALVVGPHVEDALIALAARAGIARVLAGAGRVELLVAAISVAAGTTGTVLLWAGC